MKIVIIDLETTGLDTKNHQILQIGMVCQELANRSVEESILGSLDLRIIHMDILGDPYALAMNSGLLEELTNRKPEDERFVEDYKVMDRINSWLESFFEKEADGLIHFTAAGKNIGSFDIQFLGNLPGATLVGSCLKTKYFEIRGRTIDPAPMFLSPTDEKPKSLNEIMKHLGIPQRSKHEALDDCMLVATALWHGSRL